MEINYRQQDKFSAQESKLWINLPDGSRREIDFLEIEKAIKDFCFIRHELSNYSYLYSSQLAFDTHLNLPYWEYLFVNGEIGDHDRNELEEGALLTIYLFFVEIFEAEGWCYLYRNNLFDTITKTIEAYKTDNKVSIQMIEKIKFAHQNIDKADSFNKQSLTIQEEQFIKTQNENDRWVYSEYVENYYVLKAKSFETNRTKTNDILDGLIK
jgi:hypothetical protein